MDLWRRDLVHRDLERKGREGAGTYRAHTDLYYIRIYFSLCNPKDILALVRHRFIRQMALHSLVGTVTPFMRRVTHGGHGCTATKTATTAAPTSAEVTSTTSTTPCLAMGKLWCIKIALNSARGMKERWKFKVRHHQCSHWLTLNRLSRVKK